MKKAIGQTVRELKREVNKKVLKVPGIEQKVLDATSNEPWGPHGSLLADIAHATRNYQEYQIIMSVVWKRINDTGKNWRHVYKALTVLEYLVAHGSERVIDDIREHAYQISTLSDFQYLDHNGRDQGNNVRRKSQALVSLVNDKERIQEVREKALANKDKYRSANSADGAFRSGSSHGGYGDRYDDDRSEGRYGSRDEERNGYGRERDGGYRDDDRYGRGGDSYNRDRERYGRDSDEQYGRDSYQDDSYKGGRGNDDQFGSGNRNHDRDRPRSFDEDDRYASRGGRSDDSFQHESIERRLERKLSEQITRTPPSYEEAIRDKPDSEHSENSRDGGVAVAQTSKTSSPPAYKADLPENTSQVHNHVAGVPTSTQNKEADDFDEFDPRGFVAAPPVSSTSPPDLFGDEASDLVNSLALVPVTSFASSSEADIPTNSGYGTTFVAESSTSTSMNQFNEDPFGAAPFKATPQEGFPAQQQNFAPATTFQSSLGHSSGSGSLHPVAPQMETSPSFGFGDPLGGLTYAPVVANNQDSSANGYTASSQQSYANPAFLASQSPATYVSSGFPSGTFPQAVAAPSVYSGGAQPTGQIGLQTPNMNFPQQSGVTRPIAPANLPQQPVPLAFQMALTTTGESAAKTQPKDKFETKSTVWADTLNRGLVNLNISGSKINPLADIGIDFDSINRLEKRKHEKNSPALATSTVTMGKAMGAGSGLSYENANDLPPGFVSTKFAQFSVSGLTEASEKYATRNLSAPIKASLHFSLSRSGIISFDRAEAVIEISEWVEVPKKNITLESNTTDPLNISMEASPSNNSEDKDSLNSENEGKEENKSNIEEQSPAADLSEEKILKKKTFRVPLKIVEKLTVPGILSKDSFSEAKLRLEVLDKKDAERRKTAESKNNLEEYIYATREKLGDNAEIEKVSTEKERLSFVEKLNEVEEWLYTDGEDALASEFKERLDSLKAIGDPIFLRLNELTARPAACEHARTYLSELQEIVSNWEKNKSWLPKARIDEILSEGDKIKDWLNEKEALQKKTPVFSTPVFTSDEVDEKVLRLQDQVASVNRIPKPKPKVEKPLKEQVSKDNESAPQSEQPTEEPVDSQNANTDQEAYDHDEL